jgi:hypothetical protein
MPSTCAGCARLPGREAKPRGTQGDARTLHSRPRRACVLTRARVRTGWQGPEQNAEKGAQPSQRAAALRDRHTESTAERRTAQLTALPLKRTYRVSGYQGATRACPADEKPGLARGNVFDGGRPCAVRHARGCERVGFAKAKVRGARSISPYLQSRRLLSGKHERATQRVPVQRNTRCGRARSTHWSEIGVR